MKAIVAKAYGGTDVLQLAEKDKPVPKKNELLIKIDYTSVTSAHCDMRKGTPLFGRLFIGLTKPKFEIPGTDLSGTVIEIGDNVKNFAIGDKVVAATDAEGSTYAEFISIAEDKVIVKRDENIDSDQACAILDGGLTALSFLRDHAGIKDGDKILINGASGGIGTAAVQLAKYYGAEITAVCSSKNTDLVKSLGADKVIDYTKEDFTASAEMYDIIFDTVGKRNFDECKSVLKDDGKYLTPVLSLSVLFKMMANKFRGKKLIFAATGLRKTHEKLKDTAFLLNLMKDGKLKGIIDKKFKLEDIREAHDYVEKGHKVGNVLIGME